MNLLLRPLVVLLAAAAVACGQGDAGQPGKPDGAAKAEKSEKGQKGGGKREMVAGPVPVAVAAAANQSVPITLEAVGNVEPYATVAVKSRVDGQITEVLVADGQDVARDQVLVKVDARPFQIQLQQAQANLTRDQALVTTATAQEQRYRDLLEKHYVSPDNYAEVKGKLDTATAAVATDQAAIDSARLQLEYATIRAPIGGRLGKIGLQRGNMVRANDAAAIVTINQVNPIYVSFSVPEAALGDIRAAAHRGVLPAVARKPGAEAMRGKLGFIDNAVDATTGTIKLRATFDNPKGALWPGEFANVSLELGEQAAALVIPPEAVQVGQNGPYVFVVGADSTAAVREVKVARTTLQAAVIDSGLAAGDSVVVDGASRLTNGAKVTVKAAAADAAK